MQTHPGFPHPTRRRALALFVISISVLAACAAGLASRAAQSPAAEEREFKNTIPEHVPLKVKLRNEQSFKNLKNERWARELEIEVRNTGIKPIYYVYLIINMPEVHVGGHPLTFRVAYGRKELAFLETLLEPDDLPIRAGESVTLKIRDSQVKGYENWRDKEKVADPKKIEIEMQIINFGDGTGYRSNQGIPDSAKKQSSNASRLREGPRTCAAPPVVPTPLLPGRFLKAYASTAPARLSRADSSPARDVIAARGAKC